MDVPERAFYTRLLMGRFVAALLFPLACSTACGTGSQPVRGREAAAFGGGRVENPSHMRPIMKIALIGVGGVGGYFGGKLAQAGHDVLFIARGATLEALRMRGLRVDSINGDFVIERVNATDH